MRRLSIQIFAVFFCGFVILGAAQDTADAQQIMQDAQIAADLNYETKSNLKIDPSIEAQEFDLAIDDFVI